MTIVAITRQAPWLASLIKAVLAGRTIESLAPYKPWPTRGILVPLGPRDGASALPVLRNGLLHGALTYGWRGILFFLVVCLGVSNAFENLSIMMGFPFGWYHYSDTMGPKPFLVPLLIGPAYFGMGYLSWTLARAILGDEDARLVGLLSFATPTIASFIMVSWDLTIDPMMSTINGSWVWRNGGSYFGVPVSNFLGWYLTVYIFFQCFALYARRRLASHAKAPGYWATPLLAYTSIIIAPVLSLILGAEATTVLTDPAAHQWQTHDIRSIAALVCLFTAAPFWILAVFKTGAASRPRARQEGALH